MYSMASVCLSLCVSTPFQGAQENVLNCQCVSVSLCVYSFSGGTRKCTQWPVCVCLCVSTPFQGAQENVLNGQCVSFFLFVCVSILLQGAQENVLNGQHVCVSVCLFLFRGCMKKYSMASVCLCLCIHSSSGVQENVLSGQCVCVSILFQGHKKMYSMASVYLSLYLCEYLFLFRRCKKMYSMASVCVSVSACVCLSVCVHMSSPLLGSICHAKSNGQLLPWQSQQSATGTPCPTASANVQACLSMFGA